MDILEFNRTIVTGGGSLKFSKEIHDLFGTFSMMDEMESTVRGAFFVIDHLKTKTVNLKYPILLANVGTGASFILIEEGKRFKRIGGTNIAGGTMNGIIYLSDPLKKVSRHHCSSMINEGDKHAVDILVRDIYGASYDSIGLNGDIVAGSLAKVEHYSGQNLVADVFASTAFMICSNLVHLLYLYSVIHSASSLLIGGSFPSIPSISLLLKNLTAARFSESIEINILEFGGYLGCFGILSEILLEP